MWGNIISAIGGLAGGALQQQGQDAANRLSEAQFDFNARRQDEYMHNAVLYRVNDAKRAGIHPLAALGAQLAAPGPISVGGSYSGGGLGAGLAQAGQDIGRAVSSMKHEDEKAVAMRDAAHAAAMAKTQAEIDYIRSMTNRNLESSHSVPSMGDNRLLAGQGNSPLVKLKPMEVTANRGTGKEPGQVPGVGYVTMPDGSKMLVKSKDAQDRMDEDALGNIKHFILRTFGPYFNPSGWVPEDKLKPGYRRWLDWKADYHQIPIAPNNLWRRGRHGSQRN